MKHYHTQVTRDNKLVAVECPYGDWSKFHCERMIWRKADVERAKLPILPGKRWVAPFEGS